jgi:4-diphosphocytidyl-2-C-methyl-D-erythritol kinase
MSEQSFKLPSYAKINLLLKILGKRADNYHEICTIFQTVSLCDYISFNRDEKNIVFTCQDEKIPLGRENSIVRAAELLKSAFGIKTGARIHLEKSIPAPGGLGGGSSNAATALLGLTKLWNIKIKRQDLCELGAKLGADVPFFFYGGTALGTGTGTDILPLEDFAAKHILIVKPAVDVATKDAFARLNAADLTNKSSKSILKICRDEADSLYSKQFKLTNDFEKVIFELEPQTFRVKKELINLGANSALMSGSGASVFGIFDSYVQRQKALEALQNERNWRVFPVETISRAAYEKSLRFDKILFG